MSTEPKPGLPESLLAGIVPDDHEHVWEPAVIVASMDPDTIGTRELWCDVCGIGKRVDESRQEPKP